MNFKKTIAKSLVVAMALGMVPMANLESARADAANLVFDGTTGIAKSSDAKFWGIAKEDKKGGKDSVKVGNKNYKITNIKEISGEIDVYAILKGKAGIVAVGAKSTPDTNWNVLELAAAENTFKVYAVASTSAVKGFTPKNHKGGDYGYLFASVGKKPVEVDLSASKAAIEVKLNDGHWQTVEKFFGNVDDKNVNKKLQMLGQSGSALTFRIMGDGKTWASKDAKVKISAQPKAPNVKIDITKETTTIKAGMEYQVVNSGANKTDKWKVSTDKKGVSLIDLQLGTAEAKDIYVRTPASSKKIASAVTKITVNKPAEAIDKPANNKYEATGAAIRNIARVEANVYYDITKGASLYNTSPEDLEWALVGANGKVKWSVLKASKDHDKKPSKVALKYSATAKDNTWGADGVKLFLRRSGVKQDKNGVATQSGVSAGAVMALKNIDQKFTFTGAKGEVNGDIEATNATTTASIKVATGTAAKLTINAKIDKVVGTKSVAPKLKKVTDLPKGITIKAGKIDPATGKFDIEINVSKLKDKVTATDAEFGLEFQGVKSNFKVKVQPKG